MDELLGGNRPLVRIIPASLKSPVKRALLNHAFRRALRRIRSLPPGEPPTCEMLADAQLGWNNKGFAAKLDYLQEAAARAANTEGPILECGSGLTTILLGLLAGRRGVQTWSLENSPDWYARVMAALDRYRVRGVHVRLAPLQDYGGYTWYDPPLAPMPQEFRLVLCDGPPDTTPGGRYGLMPVLGHRLSRGVVILLDDANRPSETVVLQRWGAEANVDVSLREHPSGTFAVVTRG